MRTLCFALLLAAPFAGCGVPEEEPTNPQDLNVNSHYLIESVHLSGPQTQRISGPLRSELDRVVGSLYDDSALRKLADRIKKELRAPDVEINVSRGTQPDQLVVNFEVAKTSPVDLNVARFLYNSAEGWTADGSATLKLDGNAFTFGVLSDNDTLVERFAGIRARFERKNLGTDRLLLHFEFDSFHDQWNEATLALAPSGDLYRSRQAFLPEATLVILRPLELSFGADFDRFRISPYGGAAAAKTESSNAVVSTLRYHQRWGSGKDEIEQEWNSSYSVSAATSLLAADREYTRHRADARYRLRRGHNTVEVKFLAGRITGDAPLFDRFVLGDSTLLRGWSRFDLDPLGGSRVLLGSIDYGFRFLQVFYDTGAIWDRVQDREPKQSAGVGFKKDPFQLAVAFPMKSGRADPVFYAGLNF